MSRMNAFSIVASQGMIGYDTYFMDDASTASSMELNTPENKRPIPCEQGCARYAECAAKGLECAAFRNWASRGDYADRDVARLVRAA